MKSLIIFLLIFSIIVIIHEFGHYYFARRAGILVREFAIGMGPKLFSKQADDGTTYTLRMLPMGGYVRLAGLNDEEELEPGMSVGLVLNELNQVETINLSERPLANELPVRVDEADLSDQMYINAYPLNKETLDHFYVSKEAKIMEKDGTILMVAPKERRYESVKVWQKILTNFAGPMNNFILSILVFTVIGFMIGVKPTGQWYVGEVQPNSSAALAGMVKGDQIIKMDQVEIENWEDLVANTQKFANKDVTLTVNRGQQTIELTTKIKTIKDPKTGETRGQLGITRELEMVPMTLFEKLSYGFVQTYEIIVMVISVILSWFTKGFNLNELGGPVAMAQTTQEVVQYGFMTTLQFMAAISANLGFMNLLPIPALDGGKIILNLVELVRGKPISQEKEGLISMIGVVLLLILMVLVTWNDLMRLF